MKKLRYLITTFLLWVPLLGMGQGGEDPEEKKPFVPPLDQLVQVPPSPEAAAFVKYGNTPVSQYTGTPNIAIPIANIPGKNSSLPVQLTYDASGIKVEQLATWIGLGWNLNVGGVVTRQVNGLPDDYIMASPVYYPHYTSKEPDWPLSTYGTSGTSMRDYIDFYREYDPKNGGLQAHQVEHYKYFLDNYNNSEVDTQIDTYGFSGMGISGTLIIDYDNSTAVCLEHPQYKVEVFFGATVDGPENFGSRPITKWIITDNSGNRYTFDKTEETLVNDYATDGKDRRYVSAWYLTKFQSVNSRDVYDFIYTQNPVSYTNEQPLASTASVKTIGTSSQECNPGNGSPTGEYAPKITNFLHELEEVQINQTKRLELTTSSRLDLVGRSRVTKIEVFDFEGQSQDVIELDQSYFRKDGNLTIAQHLESQLRLKLDAIHIKGAGALAGTNNALVKTYNFEYKGNDIFPERASMSQDYWGYHNGISNSSLIPNNLGYEYSGGGNRGVVISQSEKGTLSKITYPTGGSSEFFYLSNFADGTVAGGLRVYKIEDKTADNTVAKTKYFYYDAITKSDLSNLDDDFFKTGQTSGILQVPLDFDSPSLTETVGDGSWPTCEFVMLLASNQYRERSGIVTYTRVTEVEMANGKTNGFTVYKFYNQNDFSRGVSTTQAPLNGKVESVKMYDADFELIEERTSDYGFVMFAGQDGYSFQSEKYGDLDGELKQMVSGNSNSYILEYERMEVAAIGSVAVNPCSGCLIPGPTNIYDIEPFYIQPRWTYLKSETVTRYEEGIPFSTTTEYKYDPERTHFEVVSTEARDEENQLIYTKFTYPQDLSGAPYPSMVSANRTSEVIQTITKKGGMFGLVMQEQETEYFTHSTGAQLPKVLKYAQTGGSLEPRIEYEYDLDNNPKALSKDDVQSLQYLWDEHGRPMAQVAGTMENGVHQPFAYTGFESDEKGGWTYTGTSETGTGQNPSGHNYYLIRDAGSSSPLTITLDPTKVYKLGFWAKNDDEGYIQVNQEAVGASSVWTYHEVEISYESSLTIDYQLTPGGASPANSQVMIDEVRLTTLGSQLTSYAYDNAGRLITQTGPNGIPIHYQYDMHGRLVKVIDFEGNILKHLEYEYRRTTND